MLRGLGKRVGEALLPIVDLVYPPRCPACGVAIGEQNGLCLDCWQQVVVPAEPACAMCQRPFSQEMAEPGAICAPCMAKPPRHDGIAAATLYTDISRKLVLSFKHGRKLGLARLMAGMMAAKLPDGGGDMLLVPVPLHRLRLWRRGFNQAAVLARELERRGRGELLVDALERRRATPSLGGMGAKARSRALRGAIATREGAKARIEGRDVVLVDDVLTSGATSDACVRALKRAGARTVTVACFARVLNEAGSWPGQNETPGAMKAPGAT